MNVIFGTSGHAKEVYQLARVNGVKIDYFVGLDKTADKLNDIEIISEEFFFDIDPHLINAVFFGIGSSLIRFKIYNRLIKEGYSNKHFPSLIHPGVSIDPLVDKISIGIGCIVTQGCILTTEVTIGDFVHININSTISHECTIGNFTTISPSCCICGNVVLGEHIFLGAKSTIIENISVCNEVKIGAGALVIRNIIEKGTYCGVPVKKIK